MEKQTNLRWHICHEKLNISWNEMPESQQQQKMTNTKLKTTETCYPYRNS